MSEVLLLERQGKLAHLRLNRPEARNASNPALHTRLSQVWDELTSDDALHAVVLSGEGQSFCAGGDLDVIVAMHEDEAVRRRNIDEARAIVRGMIRCPLPIVTAVQGAAVGLGCSLAALSDVVVMEERAFLADPHVSVGLVAGDGGAVVFPLLMSLQRAKYYLLSGERIPARKALEIGLATEVVDDGAALARATEIAEGFARQHRQALLDTKRALNKHLERAASDVLEFALAAEARSSASPEHAEILRRMRDA